MFSDLIFGGVMGVCSAHVAIAVIRELTVGRFSPWN